MTSVAIIQARAGSSRLPRKVLMSISGVPMLEHVICRSLMIGTDRVLVATTREAEDDEVSSVALDAGVEVFRGSETDVLDRYYNATREFGADIIVRITADCPLLDPFVSAEVLERIKRGDCDYVSNIHPPTYPDGLDTEAFTLEALDKAWNKASLQSEREHVTPFIWSNVDKFRLINIRNDQDLSHLRWTVDRAEDMAFARAIYHRLYRSHGQLFCMDDVLTLLDREPKLTRINAGQVRDEGYIKSLNEEDER